jgi:hypothetical protein
MNKIVIELGSIGDSSPLVLTEVANSAIVAAGMKYNAPSHHFEVTTMWGEPLLLAFFQDQNVDAVNNVMRQCFNKREETIQELFDGDSCATFMLGRIIGDRVQVRAAFVHRSIVDSVAASQLWSGEISMPQAA